MVGDSGSFLDPIFSTGVLLAMQGGLEAASAIEAGLRVGHLGRASVRYEVGLFVAGEDSARADAHIVHVWVERATNASAAIPDRVRAALERIKAA